MSANPKPDTPVAAVPMGCLDQAAEIVKREPLDDLAEELRAVIEAAGGPLPTRTFCDCCGEDAPLSSVEVTWGDDVTGRAEMCLPCRLTGECWPGECARETE